MKQISYKAIGIILVFSLLITYSCKEENKSQVVNENDIEKLKSSVFKGDIDAYNQLGYYYESNDYAEFLPYAILMANKFNFSRAHYDVFEILISTENCVVDYNLECLTKETRDLALEYFRKAIIMGDSTASDILLDFYNDKQYYPIKELYTDTSLVAKAKSSRK